MRILVDEKLEYPYLQGKQEVALHVEQYENGRTALQLICIDNGEETEPWMTATVNLVEQECPIHEVWIKDYSDRKSVV